MANKKLFKMNSKHGDKAIKMRCVCQTDSGKIKISKQAQRSPPANLGELAALLLQQRPDAVDLGRQQVHRATIERLHASQQRR